MGSSRKTVDGEIMKIEPVSYKYSIFIILICSFVLLPFNGCSSSNKEVYELQEKCGKRCEEYFKKEIIDKGIGGGIWKYENHYNIKQNKCIMLAIFYESKIGDFKHGTMKKVIDVNENKGFGIFVYSCEEKNKCVVDMCEIMGNKCNSEKEWDLLVKPYMEE